MRFLSLKYSSLLVILLLARTFLLQAQNSYKTGLKRNDASYQSVRLLQQRGVGTKSAPPRLLPKVSLRPFCPTPGNQNQTSSCVGWAVSYAALTICRARNEQLTDRNIINRRACSPFFLYNQIAADCESGGDMLSALKFLEKEGTCYASTFGKDTNSCHQPNDERAQSEAKSLRIKDYARLFKINDATKEKVQKIKESLADSMPVIIAISLTDSFHFNQKKWWTPADDTPIADEHAVVVVGYDETDQSFELMNSWGETWGDGGFIRVPMAELAEKTFYAYQITIDGGILRGSFSFLKYLDNGKFQDVPVRFDKKTRTYETEQSYWHFGDLFQLVATGVPQGKYLYVFSFDDKGNATVHFGLGEKADTTYNILPADNLQIVVPSVESALKITKKQEFLCVSFADNDISDELTASLEKLKKPKDNVLKRINELWGNWLVNPNDLIFKEKQMAFSVKSPQNKGDVVALVLTVNAKE